MKDYWLAPINVAPSKHDLQDMKNLEWMFIIARFLWPFAGYIALKMHNPSSATLMIALIGIVTLYNAIAVILNITIRVPSTQYALGIATQTVDVLTFWSGTLLFTHDPDTAAYSFFVLVIIEATVRYGLAGSMIMGFTFALGMCGAYVFRQTRYDIPFSMSGYAYWTSLMILIALTFGLITRGTQKERQINQRLVRERTLQKERQRIARDLHDIVLKKLEGLSWEASALRKAICPVEVKEKLHYIESLSHRSTEEIRNVVYELRRDDAEEDMSLYLSNTLKTWSKEAGISTSFILSGNAVQKMPSMNNYPLRCVVSEALANIREHASASKVRISIEMSPDKIRLQIHDNGCGIDHKAEDMASLVSSGKFGILGMKERVAQIGGLFSIEDKNGTQITIEIPIQSHREES